MAKTDRARHAYEIRLDAFELGAPERIGTLYREAARTDLPASFEYEPQWLTSGRAFMLDPRLELWRGEQHPSSGSPAFGIFLDSAPDRWGRVLMERREAAASRREGRKMRTLLEIDFLLGVQDFTRMGGLRFRSMETGRFVDDQELSAPPVTTLQELASVSQRIEEPGAESLPEYERWLSMLLAPGTSLGGARPKANFSDGDGALWIAKFPARDDRYDVGAWEYLTHLLAREAGIQVPPARLESLTDRYATFCVTRFDRAQGRRRMFASAMTLLERRDGEPGASYLDLAELISTQGARDCIASDLEQLFRRVVFNVLVGNRDDHLRNHGFIREPTGWRLAPAYDLNPNPARAEHTLALDESSVIPDLDTVSRTAEYYRLSEKKADQILAEIKSAIRGWRKHAEHLRLPRDEVTRMEAVIGIPG